MPESFSEDSFLSKLIPGLKTSDEVIVGPGDDCAVVETGGVHQVIGVDQVVEDKHYLSQTEPYLVGRKLLARNLSDIAAMGATPKFALVASSSSQDKGLNWLEEFHRGILDLANQFGVLLIGGDLAQTASGSVASLTIIGQVQGGAVLRSGASDGELLFATGFFGNSFLSHHHLNFTPRIKEGCWLQEFGVTSMMDVTDGLLQDASKLSAASGLSLSLNEGFLNLREGADVKSALCDGEDYELIFTIPENRELELFEKWDFEVPLSKIGNLQSSLDLSAPVNQFGEDLFVKYGKGFDHFHA